MDVPVRYRERSYGSSNIQHMREGLVLLVHVGLIAVFAVSEAVLGAEHVDRKVRHLVIPSEEWAIVRDRYLRRHPMRLRLLTILLLAVTILFPMFSSGQTAPPAADTY